LVVVVLMMDTWQFLMEEALLEEKTLELKRMAFGGLTLPSPTSTTSYMCQNVTPQGDDIMF
jgi:hypothetical protein